MLGTIPFSPSRRDPPGRRPGPGRARRRPVRHDGVRGDGRMAQRRGTAVRPPTLTALEPAGHGAVPVDEGRYEQVRFDRADWRGVEAAHVEIDAVAFEDVDLTAARLPSARLTDVRLTSSDATNADLDHGTLLRVEIERTKLLGVDCAGAFLTDVRFVDCKLTLASFRFARLRRVEFVDCDLRQATFQGCDLRRTAFAGCELGEVEFSHSTHETTDLRGSRLIDLRGVDALRGAIVDSAQLVDLAPSLAAGVGLRVVDGGEG
ncbi:pentapeptide repeat-containing protein [Egibacter rhizosphaerae]|uniref:Pentapeptide repeat-containing protein n=2 Tax=Egibacter rhizosphaerae TaxID=1670831 RepID=A0A411YK94_9ACTN|nr:pentapeptide repeat-containing protein [Egibacter rhizosphaerae]